jgi:GGDEF domain-containing protein
VDHLGLGGESFLLALPGRLVGAASPFLLGWVLEHHGRAALGLTAALGVVAFRVHNFDRVVQAHGNEAGNKLIVQVARRIEAELERICQGGTILWRTDLPSVCRTADGELSIPLRSRVSADHIATVTHAVLEAIASQTAQAGVDYVPAISAGVALADDGTNDAEQLVGNAHAAAASNEPRPATRTRPRRGCRGRRRNWWPSGVTVTPSRAPSRRSRARARWICGGNRQVDISLFSIAKFSHSPPHSSHLLI